jgi:hypothetical protein
MRYLAFDIGCIECGEVSDVVGIFPTRGEAEAAIDTYLDGGSRWGRTGWIGQHSVEIFEVA